VDVAKTAVTATARVTDIPSQNHQHPDQLQLPKSHPRSAPSTNARIPWSITTLTQPTLYVTTSANVLTELRTDSSVPQTFNSIQSKTSATGLKMSFVEEQNKRQSASASNSDTVHRILQNQHTNYFNLPYVRFQNFNYA
jgi:hypothetical protein